MVDFGRRKKTKKARQNSIKLMSSLVPARAEVEAEVVAKADPQVRTVWPCYVAKPRC